MSSEVDITMVTWTVFKLWTFAIFHTCLSLVSAIEYKDIQKVYLFFALKTPFPIETQRTISDFLLVTSLESRP